MTMLSRGQRRTSNLLRPGFRPQLEQLEDRVVLNVTFHGGPVLANVEVEALYYGQAWQTDASLNQTAGQLNTYLQYLVNSSYMDMLNGAGYGVGRGQFTGSQIDALALGSSVSDGQIESNLQSLISNGTVPAPDANRLYVVYVAPNVLVTLGNTNSHNTFLGYHSNFTGVDHSGHSTNISYAVLPYPGGVNASLGSAHSAFDGLTAVTSHELAEAVTDPEPNNHAAWYENSTGEEIGDLANGQEVYLNNYYVQKEANQQDQPMTPAGATTTRGGIVLSATGRTLTEAANQSFTDTIASFTDSNSLDTSGSFNVTISWGDGTTSAGQVRANNSGGFDILGTHAYTNNGPGTLTYHVTVSIGDTAGASTSAPSTVNVSPPPVTPPTPPTPPTPLAPQTGQQPLFVLDAHGHLFEYQDSTGWVDTGHTGRSFQVGTDAGGQTEVWLQGLDNTVSRFDRGTWTATGVRLQTLVAGHAELFGLGLDGQLYRYQDQGGLTATGGYGRSLVAGTDLAGNDEVWLLGNNSGLYRYDQGHLTFTGGYVRTVAAGHGEAFALDGYGQLWRFQDQGGWLATGGYGRALAVGTDLAGNDEVWLQANDSTLWRYDQGTWANTGTHVVALAAGHGEVFALERDGQLYRYQDHGGLSALGHYGQAFEVLTDASGNDAVWLQQNDGNLWRFVNGQWTNSHHP